MQLPDFLRFYKEAYLPVYSDVVGYLGDKPRQVLVEIENIFAHFVHFTDEGEAPRSREENLKRAYNHLVRVTIDCYKILWIEIKNDLLELDGIARTTDISPAEFFAAKNEFKMQSMRARALEMTSVGVEPQECIKAYEDVINLGWNILGKFKNELIAHQSSGAGPMGEDPPEGYRPPFALASDIESGVSEL